MPPLRSGIPRSEGVPPPSKCRSVGRFWRQGILPAKRSLAKMRIAAPYARRPQFSFWAESGKRFSIEGGMPSVQGGIPGSRASALALFEARGRCWRQGGPSAKPPGVKLRIAAPKPRGRDCQREELPRWAFGLRAEPMILFQLTLNQNAWITPPAAVRPSKAGWWPPAAKRGLRPAPSAAIPPKPRRSAR